MPRKDASSRLPRGVSFDKSHRGRKKYKTRFTYNGKERFIGRYETVIEATEAYRQAAAIFSKRSDGDESSSSELLQQVRTLINNAHSSPSGASIVRQLQSPAEYRESAGQQQSGHRSAAGPPEVPEPLVRQPSLTSTFSNSQSPAATSDVEQGPVPPACTTTAAGAAAVSGIRLESLTAACQQYSGCDGSFKGLTDQLLEEAMVQELSKAMGLAGPSAPQQQHLQQLLASQPEQLLQQDATTGHVQVPSSCSNPAAASAQQLQQQAQSCSPSQFAGPAAAAAWAGPAWATAAEHQHGDMPVGSTQAQQQQQQQPQGADSELQQLLMMALEGARHTAGQPHALSAAQLHEQALQECCDEFLAATASTAPALAASLQGACPAQQQHFGCRSESPAGMPAQRASFEVSSGPMSAPAGKDRHCAQGITGLHAVLYVASIMRAALDMYTALLHRMYEEDAAADIVQWLSVFRQQQQLCGSALVAAASGSVAATADMQSLNAGVMQVVASMAGILLTPANCAPAASSTGSTDADGSVGRASASGNAYAAAANRASSSAAPLARRTFVMAVLERLNGWLAALHTTLQQQHNLAAESDAMWREVQSWRQQLHTQAACPEDQTAVQLAALL